MTIDAALPGVAIAHAFTPRETATFGGRDHVIVLGDFDRPRFKRKNGDALCRPRSKFWGLEQVEDPKSRRPCPKCMGLAHRYGLTSSVLEILGLPDPSKLPVSPWDPPREALGCCVDRRYGKGCVESTCMHLPIGETCRSCAHVVRCTTIFGQDPDDPRCQFFPRRFLLRKVQHDEQSHQADQPPLDHRSERQESG